MLQLCSPTHSGAATWPSIHKYNNNVTLALLAAIYIYVAGPDCVAEIIPQGRQ